ncbi:MAG TPA: histidine kinase dimerization/phospho-acceptor domain-containing protein [Gemmatimonadaceae bacterium]|nr:histidine kinase dimerization/phospho-acceptor domain-containing protein [Gemmatimonadaceae bacterium]
MPETSGRSSQKSGVHSASDLQMLASRLQHQLNNPLAALLAESQLLAAEDMLGEDHRAAVQRIVELVRRVIGIVRALDDAEKVLDTR